MPPFILQQYPKSLENEAAYHVTKTFLQPK